MPLACNLCLAFDREVWTVVKVSLAGGDAVTSYFGLRTFALDDGPKCKRPLLNGNFTFLAGFLDQVMHGWYTWLVYMAASWRFHGC